MFPIDFVIIKRDPFSSRVIIILDAFEPVETVHDLMENSRRLSNAEIPENRNFLAHVITF
jgi:hypothetical protein